MKLCFRELQECFYSDLSSIGFKDPLTSFRVEALESNIFKKYLEDKEPEADSRALEKFLLTNEKCGEWKLDCRDTPDEYLIGEFKSEIYRFWHLTGDKVLVESLSDLTGFGRTGPGSSLNVPGTDYYTKMFNSRFSTTSEYLYHVYRRSVEYNPISFHAEMARIADYGMYRVVEGNRLCFVPKRNDISRVICVEPSLNMFFQMGFKHILESRIRQIYNIDLRDQPSKNRELARLGSRDNSLVTLDLSSASDSISVRMLESMFPRSFVNMLKSLRSPLTRLPDGRAVKLHMISSMGNATTFPLETLIFRAILSAASRLHPKHIDPGLLAVFGDDMIYPCELHGKVLRLLRLLGFQVNADKTFVEGPFRESCGHDYLNGHDVRPVFIRTLKTQQDRYVAINLLNAWSAKSGVPLLRTVHYLLSFVRRNFVPPYENFDSGILAPSGFLNSKRFDRNGSIIYRAMRPVPLSIKVKTEKRKISGLKGRKLTWNPSGLLASFLRGYIRDNTINIRHDGMMFSAKRCVTPNWDHIPTASVLGGVLNLPGTDVVLKRRWNYAVYVNLS